MAALYDRIGTTYAQHRRPDARIDAAINNALGPLTTICSIGSGTGSYEPRDRAVVAIEPSQTMISQRPAESHPVVQGVAEHLPFPDGAFGVALAVLTVHHWRDYRHGLAEMIRVARRQVVLTWDPAVFSKFWLVSEYVPELATSDVGLAEVSAICTELDVNEVRTVPVPWDCTDGFAGAYWRRPALYLDPAVRGAISGLAMCAPDVITRAMADLQRDLDDGTWQRRYGDLAALNEIDIGYRLVIAGEVA
ncbi:MAG TPA: methyltransferase domain-containing protein [Dehalococcoidia bacterium]